MRINLGVNESETVSSNITEDELKVLIDTYNFAKELGDYETVNELIDIRLRCFLQRTAEHYYANLEHDAKACGVSEVELQKYRNHKKIIEDLVFDDSAWEQFSKRLKNGDSLSNLGLIRV
jgi:hypothetical protein